MTESSILVQREAGYRIVTLNRPAKLNAFNDAMHEELRAALDDAEADADCRALLLTGAGRAFSTGQDLNDRLLKPGEKPVPRQSVEKYYNPLVRKLRALPFPVVAAVNGAAVGAGANVALACDIVLAARSATFTQSFARIGLTPDSGGSHMLPRLIGEARARALMLTAQPVTAERASEWGMIWRCVDDDQLMPESTALCAQFAKAPTQGLALIKRALDASPTNSFDEQLELERAFHVQAVMTPDYAEGVRAFMEKRPPQFRGRKE